MYTFDEFCQHYGYDTIGHDGANAYAAYRRTHGEMRAAFGIGQDEQVSALATMTPLPPPAWADESTVPDDSSQDFDGNPVRMWSRTFGDVALSALDCYDNGVPTRSAAGITAWAHEDMSAEEARRLAAELVAAADVLDAATNR